jgi:catechol 2,3-dioxygenase-like lactoylglutathione lyase family enzyme
MRNGECDDSDDASRHLAKGATAMSSVRVSHVGLCVSDLDRSLRFYTEGLGFELVRTIPIGDEAASVAEMAPGLLGQAAVIASDGVHLELLSYEKPGTQGSPSSVRNQLGLTHLCFNVDSIAETSARLVSLGATILESTRTRLNTGRGHVDMIVLTDVDGNRIELLEWENDG